MMRVHFKDRIFEWWLAANTTGFGLFLAMPGRSMDSTAYDHLTGWLPEWAWAGFFFWTGFAHLVALLINGRRWWTPIIRSCTTALNCAVYIFFGLGFLLIDPLSTAVYSYMVLIATAAAICFFRATVDTAAIFEVRRRDAY